MKKVLLVITLYFFSNNLILSQTRDSFALQFPFDEYQVNSSIAARLDSFINSVQDRNILLIRLNGHCDSKGSDQYNDALSLKRADAVGIYLLERNIVLPISIIEKGFGKRSLLNKDATENESLQNRRVEVVIFYDAITKTEPQLAEQILEPVNDEKRSLTVILKDTALKTGDIVALPDLHFYGGFATVLPGSLPLLRELRAALINNPKLKIDIEGHICCTVELTDPQYHFAPNFMLSQRRAKMVWEYLTQNGIDPTRLSYKGFGSTRPLYPLPEKTEEERVANRRVEIKIIDK
jgi:outer membrane protein OmpA-like peptidoglycan-associated protein